MLRMGSIQKDVVTGAKMDGGDNDANVEEHA